MGRNTKYLLQIYALLLRFYPPRFRREFEAEMIQVMDEAVAATAKRGWLALTVLCLRELRDLPPAVLLAHWYERRIRKVETRMKTRGDERSPWGETLVGVLPFLIFGPLTVLLAYPFPYTAWRTSAGGMVLVGIVYVLPLMIGFAWSWAKGRRRSLFPYLGLILLLLLSLTATGASMTPARALYGLPFLVQLTIAFGVPVVLIGVLVLFFRSLGTFYPLYQSIRRDWTRLSFGLSISVTILFSMIDHEEEPSLRLSILLPGVIMATGAVLYQRSETKARRVVILLSSIIFALFVRILDGSLFYLLAGVPLGIIVFLPALLDWVPSSDSSEQPS
ncbi:MAG: hypothetical protein ACM3S0_16655 [Acidobacteriota bacterium]